jgi:hypothetical protein
LNFSDIHLGGVDKNISIIEPTRVLYPVRFGSRIREVYVRRRGIFGFNKIEILHDASFFAAMSKLSNVLDDVFRSGIKFIKRSNDGLSLSGTIGGAKYITECTSFERKKHDSRGGSQVDELEEIRA